MKKLTLFITLLILALSNILIVSAHSGRTDSRGGHYCRTNCPKWGLKYGQYHYHGVTKKSYK